MITLVIVALSLLDQAVGWEVGQSGLFHYFNRERRGLSSLCPIVRRAHANSGTG